MIVSLFFQDCTRPDPTTHIILYAAQHVRCVVWQMIIFWAQTRTEHLLQLFFKNLQRLQLSDKQVFVFVNTHYTHLLLSAVLRRRCCWASAAVDRYLLPVRRSAANPPLLRSNDGTDGRTDRQTPDNYIDPALHSTMRHVSYDTIRDAILTCARKPTWVGLIYRTETTTKNYKTEKLKSKNSLC